MKSELMVHHLESHLGRIDYGWRLSEGPHNIRVVRFRDQPRPGASTFVTLGLSDHVLNMPRSRSVRQELLFSAADTFNAEDIASVAVTLSYTVASRGSALLRGEVVGPSTPIVRNTHLNAIYAAMPVLFEESFWTLGATSPPTVLVWGIPLYASEALYIAQNGWSVFEDMLEAANPDLLDFGRDPLK